MVRVKEGAVAGIGGGLAIAALVLLGEATAVPLLLAPFGASCVLVFGVPGSPFAKPRNVIGGYLVSACMGLIAVAILGGGAAGLGLGVGAAISAMMMSETVHPPAGAVPIIVGLTHPDLLFLATPVTAGAVLIVLMGLAWKRLVAWPAFRRSRRNASPGPSGAPR